MRKVTRISDSDRGFQRLMLYAANEDGAFLFLYRSLDDGPCDEDRWYESAAEAEEAALQEFAVKASDWQLIPDPMPECQDDWVVPVRVKRNARGELMYGQFERLSDDST